MLFRCGANVRGADNGAQTTRGCDRLKARNANAHNKNLSGGYRARRGHHHREGASEERCSFDHRAIAGEVRLRTQRVHRLRAADPRNELHRDRVDLCFGERLDRRLVAVWLK